QLAKARAQAPRSRAARFACVRACPKGGRGQARVASRAFSDEQAPQRAQPALTAPLRRSDSANIADTAESSEAMNAGSGVGWSASGVPAIGTNGTTKGYTPKAIMRPHMSRMDCRLSPKPAST